jgi:hypothetical protein
LNYFFTGLFCFLSVEMACSQQIPRDTLNVKHNKASNDWSFAVEAYYYILPNEKNTTTIIGYADYKAFHSEIRYNYEDMQTVSVFGGYRFNTGHSFIVEVTPIIGLAAGNTDGVIPGLLLNLTWKKFDFYSESEYVMNFEGNENNYFYTWSELGITPFNNFRTGISANRTRLIHSNLDFQRGIFIQYTFRKLTAGFHYFNPLTSESYGIITVGYEF